MRKELNLTQSGIKIYSNSFEDSNTKEEGKWVY